ncbi:hypothetical protein ANT_12810 [Anaerolinea thermophila UNI-1]|uniref:Uncharacterized protein n=1 Tax=Anaerolinea thermophila (strain DSM 14523 / JCM 11388 / NBRC 100420 / UNI-1) TaxID=926569 RepID=E8N4F1_ANATU|nr:hypothetical protein ANT_12810 [Anaerolinea thermophila UNI-1]
MKTVSNLKKHLKFEIFSVIVEISHLPVVPLYWQVRVF